MKNYLVQNVNLAELAAKMPFFRKIQNFIKSQNFQGLFPNSIPTSLNIDLVIKKYLAQSKKFPKVNAISSILRKAQNPIKFESFSNFGQIEKLYYLDFIYNHEGLFGSKREFHGTCSGNALFSKNSKFHKISKLSRVFLKFNPNILEHWSRYKEIFSSI